MADPVFVDEVTPLNAVNMNKLQTRDEKGAVGGYPSLDGTGKVPAAQLPAGGGGGATDISYEGAHVPASSHDDGDIVIKDGILYLAQRTTVQTPDPSLWGAVGPTPTTRQGELAYAQITATVTTSSQVTLVTAPAVTLDGVTPIVVEFSSPLIANSVDQGGVFFRLLDNGADIGYLGAVYAPGTDRGVSSRMSWRGTPAAGSHAFGIAMQAGSGIASATAGAGGASVYLPTFVRVSLASPAIIPTPGHLVPVSYGITLPTAPVDGQEAILVDSVTNPTYTWRFRYNAGSSSAYKWEFVGGAPLSSEVVTNALTLSTAYVDLSPAGPSIALPRAGDYMVTLGCNCWAASRIAYMSYAIGGTAAVDADGVYGRIDVANNVIFPSSRTRRKDGLGAVTLTAKYRCSQADTNAAFENRFLMATPVRVS